MQHDVQLLTPGQAAERLGISRSTMYVLISSGEVESITVRRARRIPVEALAQYVARQRAAAAAT